ncbi:MAG: IS110 family transposase, partial [Nocardioidaceae bacterium]
MFTERTSAGLDVHARSVAAAAIDGVTGELFQTTLTPAYEHIRGWLRELPGPVAVTYEAGPTGFGLYRALTAAGIRCEVAAPSKLQRPAGDRVKTDARDAIHLAKLLRLDEVTSVTVPSVEQETARDLVRAREDCRGDLMRARHRLSKLLLRHGIVYYDGDAWTGKHDAWLRRLRFEVPATELVFASDYDAVLTTTARPGPPGRRDRGDGRRQPVHAGGEAAQLSAWGVHPDRVRPGRRDR